MIIIDPQTRQRVVIDKGNSDVQYDANLAVTTTAVGHETIAVVGPWSDWTGSASPDSRTQQMFAGMTNQLFGTTAAIESNVHLPPLNEVGDNKETTRRRTRRIYNDVLIPVSNPFKSPNLS